MHLRRTARLHCETGAPRAPAVARSRGRDRPGRNGDWRVILPSTICDHRLALLDLDLVRDVWHVGGFSLKHHGIRSTSFVDRQIQIDSEIAKPLTLYVAINRRLIEAICKRPHPLHVDHASAGSSETGFVEMRAVQQEGMQLISADRLQFPVNRGQLDRSQILRTGHLYRASYMNQLHFKRGFGQMHLRECTHPSLSSSIELWHQTHRQGDRRSQRRCKSRSPSRRFGRPKLGNPQKQQRHRRANPKAHRCEKPRTSHMSNQLSFLQHFYFLFPLLMILS